MHISSQVLRLALLRVFAEAGVGVGGSLGFAQISAGWPRTGLRGLDLRDAVRELLDSGDLVASGQDETLRLTLSPAALRSLREPYGELQLANFEDEATLFVARYRQHGGRGPELRQRADDQARQTPA